MRIYFPLLITEIEALADSQVLNFERALAVSPTPELAALLEISDTDELTLIAALTAADLALSPSAIAVVEAEAEVGDAELGEVFFSGDVRLSDLECLLVPDLENDDISWFGIQETTDVIEALRAFE